MCFKSLLLAFYLLIISSQTILSQNETIDSIKNLSYEELETSFFNNLEIDSIANKYVETYLKRAKENKNIIKIANSYLYKSYISNYKDAIEYSDSIIELTQNLNDIHYPALGFMIKGYYYYNKGKDKEALGEYLKANEYALKNNNIGQQIEIKQFIGGIKTNFGNFKEALDIFKEQLQFIKKQPDYKDKYKEDYLIVLNDLSKTFLRGKILDSALIYTKKGIEVSLYYQNIEMYNRFLLNSGATYYFLKDYNKALDSLNKIEPELIDNNLALCFYYKAKIYQKKDKKKSLFYFKKVDSIYQKTQIPFIELRDVYKAMFDYYSIKGTEKKQLESVKKLIKIDSIIDVDFKYINNSIGKDYNIPKLEKEKRKLEKELVKKGNENKGILIALILLLAFSLLFMSRFYKKLRLYKRHFEEIINKETPEIKLKELSLLDSTNKLNISNQTLSDILEKLNTFESEYNFTKNEITLNKLAQDFNTNTTYLSKIINHHKNESFSNYLNSLRIDYAVKKLKKNKSFRNFTIAAISEEVGFNNPESFSKAFYKRTAIYPSYFINQLNNEACKLKNTKQ